MSTCERCWSNAFDPNGDQVTRYSEFITTRHQHCTPEQQAGPGGHVCPNCARATLHQYTREPMCGCPRQPPQVCINGNCERAFGDSGCDLPGCRS